MSSPQIANVCHSHEEIYRNTQVVMENQSTLVEADAVHHRLSNQVNSVIHLPYRCYDCSQSFFGLEQLTQHFLEKPLHTSQTSLLYQI
ncbi:hypothetical protein OUZ56_014358 [Daphnia magna]|uniref:C2H2-type domain-containing protein n=1 Tax=Daphnia magna TaxID=35525 RepID=A0ABR0AJL6_9CRUS|nr:hypothetical protein OUZ56_014358 [Daphnia magna]